MQISNSTDPYKDFFSSHSPESASVLLSESFRFRPQLIEKNIAFLESKIIDLHLRISSLYALKNISQLDGSELIIVLNDRNQMVGMEFFKLPEEKVDELREHNLYLGSLLMLKNYGSYKDSEGNNFCKVAVNINYIAHSYFLSFSQKAIRYRHLTPDQYIHKMSDILISRLNDTCYQLLPLKHNLINRQTPAFA